jgi:hypothetical protein
MKQKYILLLCVLVGVFYGAIAKAEEGPIISQIQITGGTGKTTEDFVEIFNPNNTPLNLKDYRLVKRTKNGITDTTLKSWTADTFIPARSFFLWANSAFTSIAVVPDVVTTGSLANDNGVALRLGVEDVGTLVDSVSWGESSNGFVVATSQNMEANQALLRTNLNDRNSNFNIISSTPRNSSISEGSSSLPPAPSPSSSSTPASTSTQSPSAPPKTNTAPVYEAKSLFIKITEILPNPEGEDSGSEAVEIQNSGNYTVDLDGWYIDDKNSGTMKATAWQISQVTIGPGEYLVFNIPKNKFSLNNTGGDAVNLYFADKTLADSVTYTEDAKENISYQKFQGAWVWSVPSLGKANFAQTFEAVESNKIFINEILANPAGSDEGQEWVEIINTSNVAVNLKGFALDNGKDSQNILSNAVILDEKITLPPNGLMLINLPEDKFSLLNSGDTLRFFNSNGKLLETVNIPMSPEGKSYFRDIKGKWEFGIPTPGFSNSGLDSKNEIIISEFLPSPAPEQDEFVELQNISTSTPINLSGFVLQIGNRSLKLLEKEILPGEFYIISEEDLPGHLPNAGGTISLLDGYGRVISKVIYEQAKVGQSFAYTEDGKYAWTESPSPEKANTLVLGESVVLEKPNTRKTSATVDKKTEKVLLSENMELKRDILDLSNQVALLSQKIDDLSTNLNIEKPEPVEVLPVQKNNESTEADKPTSSTKYLFISGLAFVGLLFIGFKYAKNVL